MDKRICRHCGKEVSRKDMSYVSDSYGIPYKLVCDDCYDEVDAEINGFVHDESYCGERLEEDY